MRIRFRKLLLTAASLAGLLLSFGIVHAVTGPGNILADQEASEADATALVHEAGVFGAIRMGIALSMAQCGDATDCSPPVNEDELKQLIQTLDTRIDDLTLRQEEAEDPEGFSEVIATYVNERDQVAHFMDKLGTLKKDIEGIGEEVVDEEVLMPEEEVSGTEEPPAEKSIDLARELEFFEEDIDLGEENLPLEDDLPLEEDLPQEENMDPDEPLENIQ